MFIFTLKSEILNFILFKRSYWVCFVKQMLKDVSGYSKWSNTSKRLLDANSSVQTFISGFKRL